MMMRGPVRLTLGSQTILAATTDMIVSANQVNIFFINVVTSVILLGKAQASNPNPKFMWQHLYTMFIHYHCKVGTSTSTTSLTTTMTSASTSIIATTSTTATTTAKKDLTCKDSLAFPEHVVKRVLIDQLQCPKWGFNPYTPQGICGCYKFKKICEDPRMRKQTERCPKSCGRC